MHRFLVLLIVLGLLLPSASSAGAACPAVGNPFAKPSFKNDSSGTVSALPVQEDVTMGFIRPESRHPFFRHPPSSDLPLSLVAQAAPGSIPPGNDILPCSVSYGLPPECGMTVVRLARADH